MEQRSSEWFNARLGRFTASGIHKLMGVKGLGETGRAYCFEKSVELVFGQQEESATTFDMQRGIDLEPLAFRKFKEIKQEDFIEVKETTFFPYGNIGGASPDGLVGTDAVLEIKCPRPNKFFNIVANGEIEKEYLFQMQMQMLCTNSAQCHFFNYIIFNGTEMWHDITVERDDLIIELIKDRINEAVLIRDGLCLRLTSNKQF